MVFYGTLYATRQYLNASEQKLRLTGVLSCTDKNNIVNDANCKLTLSGEGEKTKPAKFLPNVLGSRSLSGL